MHAYLAEFFGTMILIILGDGVVAGAVLKGTKIGERRMANDRDRLGTCRYISDLRCGQDQRCAS